jgi:glutaredoxin
MRTVTLYTKADCCLCDEALEVIERARRERRFEFVKVDISTESRLMERYGERIPVVLVDGVEEFEYRVDLDRLLSKVADPVEASA